jgi:ectoine hydroxylase-related dioxygenase (phytanoyl-CoA dioxygenase family)
VVSVLLAIDECSEDSGCLWLAPPAVGILPVDERGVVRADVCAQLEWAPAELAPGDAVCIDGYAAHYSEANRSNAARRVLVASYSPAGSGYDRSTYYARRSDEMQRANARDGRFRISTLADFAGVEVTPDSGAVGECEHPAARDPA